MPRTAKSASPAKDSDARLGFETKRWFTAQMLSSNMDAAAEERSIPASAADGIFVQSELSSEAPARQFVESQGGQPGDICICNQAEQTVRLFGFVSRTRRERPSLSRAKQCNPKKRGLAITNLSHVGAEADFGPENTDTFCRDLRPALRTNNVASNAVSNS